MHDLAQISSFHPLYYLSKESHANLNHPEKLWLGQVYFPRTKPHALLHAIGVLSGHQYQHKALVGSSM